MNDTTRPDSDGQTYYALSLKMDGLPAGFVPAGTLADLKPFYQAKVGPFAGDPETAARIESNMTLYALNEAPHPAEPRVTLDGLLRHGQDILEGRKTVTISSEAIAGDLRRLSREAELAAVPVRAAFEKVRAGQPLEPSDATGASLAGLVAANAINRARTGIKGVINDLADPESVIAVKTKTGLFVRESWLHDDKNAVPLQDGLARLKEAETSPPRHGGGRKP